MLSGSIKVTRCRILNTAIRMSSTTATSSAEQDVLFANVNNTKVVTLNRPSKLNALNESMISKLHPRYAEYAKSNITNLIIQKSEGRAFCAGGDVASCVENNLTANPLDSARFFKEEYSLNYLLATYPKPIVTFQDGITMGGGVGLSIHTPFRIATEKTRWAMPEMDIGFSPDVGTTFALNKVISSPLGWYLALTGEIVNGWDNYFCGLSTHFVPSERLPQLEKELTRVDLSHGDKYTIVNNIIENYTEPLPENYQFVHSVEELKLIDAVFHPEATVESIFADLNAANTPFATRTLETLKKKSSLSLKVALELLQRGAKSDIHDALTNELHAARQFMIDSDFNEGVSSKLIRKSKEVPNWKFKAPQEISVKDLLPFFKRESGLALHDHFGITFNQYPHNFGLPKEAEIEAYINGETKAVDASLNRNDVIKHFVQNEAYKGKAGLVKYLNFVLDIKTEGEDKGLKWKL